MLDHIRQIKNGWGVASFDRRICFLTEEYKEHKIKVKRYFLMAKHLFTFSSRLFYPFTSQGEASFHLFTFSPLHLFTLSPFKGSSSERHENSFQTML